ncbi:MAG TPA: hypothetical protein VJ802_05165 [Gemmatimonadaceae bacterium]|nr:hypothetical protein [Gemmatimonadaceae bacterium]
MHPRKAELLARTEQMTRDCDVLLEQAVRLLVAPERRTLASFGATLVALPLTGLAAAAVDLAYVMIARTDDGIWDSRPRPASHG